MRHRAVEVAQRVVGRPRAGPATPRQPEHHRRLPRCVAAARHRHKFHKCKNVLGHLPERLHASVGKALRDAWNLDSAGRAARVLERLARSLERDHPGAVGTRGIDPGWWIFLHLAFDDWMRTTHPDVPFERYADDIVAHCRTETQALHVLSHIKRRLAQCRLEVHPEKTHIVYCKDDDRPGQYPTEQFTFLGYTFRSRRSKNRWGKYFINFAPAVSNAAATRMRQAMRRRHLPRRSDKAIDDLARMWNPVLRGWIQYYGRFYKGCGSLFVDAEQGPLGASAGFWERHSEEVSDPSKAVVGRSGEEGC